MNVLHLSSQLGISKSCWKIGFTQWKSLLCHSNEGSETEHGVFSHPAPSVAHGVRDVYCWKRREGEEKQCGLANTWISCRIDMTLSCSVRVDSYIYYFSFLKTRYRNIDRKCGNCCKRWREKWCISWTSPFISLCFCSKKLFCFPRGFGRCLWLQSESRSKHVQMSYLPHPCSCGAHSPRASAKLLKL